MLGMEVFNNYANWSWMTKKKKSQSYSYVIPEKALLDKCKVSCILQGKSDKKDGTLQLISQFVLYIL